MKLIKRLAITATVMLTAASFALPAIAACGPDKPTPAKTTKAAKPADVAIPVDGMSCGGCANKVQSELMKLSGVLSATVSFENKSAVIHYDATKISTAQLVASIKGQGYKTGTPKPMKRQS